MNISDKKKIFKSPVGYPVIVRTQVKDGFKTFYGLVLRLEDAYNLRTRYKGAVSIVRVFGSFGQNEQIEIHHGIEHFSKRVSAHYWKYLDEKIK